MSINICPRCKGKSQISDNPNEKSEILCCGCQIETMITLETFSTINRTKYIGNSMYRICNTAPANGTGKWYIHETYNDGIEWSRNTAHHNNDLQTVIDIFNGIAKEKEIISFKHAFN